MSQGQFRDPRRRSLWRGCGDLNYRSTRIAAREPKAAPRRLLENAGHVARGRTIGLDEKRPNRVIAEGRVEHQVELRTPDEVGQRGEGVEIVERLGDFRRAAMSMAHLAGEPARIGGAAA